MVKQILVECRFPRPFWTTRQDFQVASPLRKDVDCDAPSFLEVKRPNNSPELVIRSGIKLRPRERLFPRNI